MQPLILIVDDDTELSTMLVELLDREGWSTFTVLTSRGAGVWHIPLSAW